MNFMNLIEKRYTVRSFSDKKLEQEKLDLILKAGNMAPTAKNQQPQRIYVLQSEKAIAKINKLCPCIYGAQTVLLFTYSTDEEWHNRMEDGIYSGIEDVSIVATHMMLEATELGVATCWVNCFPNTETMRTFDLPENEKAVLLMPIGYAADNALPSPNHTTSKDLVDIVRYI